MNILRGKANKPRRCLMYGTKGVGKSSWANAAPSPLFLTIEDGLDSIDCARTAWLTSAQAVVDAIGWLANADHEFKTVVVDSLDWLENLLFDSVAKKHGKKHIDEIGYAKGYDEAAQDLRFMFQGLEYLRASKGMLVILLAHEQITAYTPPGGEKYDRYTPALHKSVRAIAEEWVDEIFFASYRVFTKSEDVGFNKKRHVAMGGTDRYIRTTENAAIVAKNRLDMPPEIPMVFAEYQKYWPTAAVPVVRANVDGVVVNGSSKVLEKVSVS